MATNPDHYAIVIGIDGYSQLRRLRSSGADATRFAEWLHSGGGLPDENIKLITSPPKLPADPLEAAPVARHIHAKLIELGIKQQTRIGKRLYFYFAGHGIGPTMDDVGMLLADAAMDQLNSNLGLRPYRLFFRTWRFFDEIVFILDCCRDPIAGIKTGEPIFTFQAQAAGDQGLPSVTDFVVLAAAYGRQAFEPLDNDTNERRGLLTEVVLEALEGRAPEAIDPVGRVTVPTLRTYVSNRMPELTETPALKQVPIFVDPDPPAEIVLATFPVAKVHVHIKVPAGADGDLVLRYGQSYYEIARRPVAEIRAEGGTWDLLLNRGSIYAIEHAPSGLLKRIDLRGATDPHVVQFPLG